MSPLNAFLKIDDNNPGDTSFQNQIFKNIKSFQDKEFCNKYMGSTLSFLFFLKMLMAIILKQLMKDLPQLFVN